MAGRLAPMPITLLSSARLWRRRYKSVSALTFRLDVTSVAASTRVQFSASRQSIIPTRSAHLP